MSIETKDWRKYERKNHNEFSKIFTDCNFQFDDKIYGKYSKIDR